MHRISKGKKLNKGKKIRLAIYSDLFTLKNETRNKLVKNNIAKF